MAARFDEQWLRDYCNRTRQPNPLDNQPRGTLDSATPSAASRPARRKYGNTPTERDGRRFDSIHEANVYDELILRVRAGELLGVYCQHPFLLPGGVVYRADFVVLYPGGRYEVLDAKSEATKKDKVYRLKKRQMRECLGIEIQEV